MCDFGKSNRLAHQRCPSAGPLAGFGAPLMKTASGSTYQANPFDPLCNGFLDVFVSLYSMQAASPFYLPSHLLLPSTAMLAQSAQTLVLYVSVATLHCPPKGAILICIVIIRARCFRPSYMMFREFRSENPFVSSYASCRSAVAEKTSPSGAACRLPCKLKPSLEKGGAYWCCSVWLR